MGHSHCHCGHAMPVAFNQRVMRTPSMAPAPRHAHSAIRAILHGRAQPQIKSIESRSRTGLLTERPPAFGMLRGSTHTLQKLPRHYSGSYIGSDARRVRNDADRQIARMATMNTAANQPQEPTRVGQDFVNSNIFTSTAASGVVQRAAPVVAGAAALIGKVVARCIIGAISGVLFDAVVQAILHSWKKKSWRFWKVSLNYCSLILSAILGCIAAPISARLLEPWIAAKLGSRLGGIVGTLIGKILIFIAKKLGMAIPKGIVGALLKLKCISKEQANELGVAAPAMAR